MARFPAAVLNAAADAMTALISHISLHDGPLSTDEIAVTRQAVTWGAAASGVAAMTGTEVFADVPAGADVAFIGFWSALSAGTFRGWSPAGSVDPVPFTAVAGTDILTADAHGLVDTDTVIVFDTLGAALPTGLTEAVVYHVRDVSGDTFKLAATAGGAAIDLTADGAGFVQKITVESFAGAGEYTVSALEVDANL